MSADRAKGWPYVLGLIVMALGATVTTVSATSLPIGQAGSIWFLVAAGLAAVFFAQRTRARANLRS